MAQKTLVQFVDDLSGKPIAAGKGETISFGLDGTTYEIDLNEKNAAKLRDALVAYTSAGRRVNAAGARGRGTAGRARRTPRSLKAIREWAAENGYKVSERGRIPKNVVDAYEQAND